MIKIANIRVAGIYSALYGMRLPLQSHHLSDSRWIPNLYNADKLDYEVGEADSSLMHRLYKAGTEHRKYARQIHVWMLVTAPLYWWKEFDTYKIGVTANSTSTMHKIHAKEFTLEDFSTDKLNSENLVFMECVIAHLNKQRDRYLLTKDKDDWWQMIQLLPSTYHQTRMLDFNYEVALNIIRQRENHKLDEWREFVSVLKSLPEMNKIMQK